LNEERKSTMQLTSQLTPLAEVDADWLIVGIWEHEGLSAVLTDLDARVGGVLTRLLDYGDVTGKAKELTPILDMHGIRATRILALGLGARAKIDFAGLVAAAAAAARSLTTKSLQRVALVVPEQVPGIDPEGVARALGVGFMQGSEGPGLRKTKQDRFAPTDLLLIPSSGQEAVPIEAGTRRADVKKPAWNVWSLMNISFRPNACTPCWRWRGDRIGRPAWCCSVTAWEAAARRSPSWARV
jgi:leucyl aminopeptidase